MKSYLLSACFLLSYQGVVHSGEVLESVIAEYQQQEKLSFSAASGKALWEQEISFKKSPNTRSCASCHGNNLAQSGKHIKTGKVIKPMAPSINPERFTNKKKIEKWFFRNCKWTWGRECSPQEKGDILRYLSQQ